MDEALALLSIAVSSFLVGLSGAVSPGPLLALDIRESAHRGFWAGPLVSTGHALTELGVTVLLVVGLGQVLRAPTVAGTVGIAGGLFLLWMAWGVARTPVPAVIAHGPAGAQAKAPAVGVGPILGGAGVTVANPYWLLWWATVGLSFLERSTAYGAVGVLAFYLGHISADYTWYSLVSAGIATGRRVLTPVLYRGLLVACALFLVAMGLFFAVSGVGKLGLL